MDRPKQHRLIFFGLALLAGVVLLLLVLPGTERTSTPTTASTKPQLQSKPAEAAPAISETVASNTTPPAPASTADPKYRGVVIDAATRRPITDFAVQLIHAQGPPITRNFSSATGRFTLTDLTTGTWRAAVSAAGYQMFNLGELRITEDQATHEIVVPLLRGFAVRGRVFELSTGAPVVGAHISFRERDDADRFAKMKPFAQSQQDGSFVLDGVPAGDIVLTVGARKYARRELAISVDEQTPPQSIGLSTGATIAGMVTTVAGAPASGSIFLKTPGIGQFSKTNEAGQFSFQHLPPGRYRVMADTSAGSASLEFMLGQDEIKDVTLIVGAGRSVRGVLKGLRTDQLQSVHISLRSSEGAFFTGRSDERGGYALHGVPPGRAVLTVGTSNLRIERTLDVPNDRDVTFDIAIPTGARLSGRITQGGKPAAGSNVWMSPVGERSDILYRARTSEDGQYEIEGLPSGDYRLATDEDITRMITMAGDTVLNIDIPLAQITARVVEEGGIVPIVGAKVYARGSAPETARVSADKQTDDFGQFTLVGIEPGEVVLMVYEPGYELYRETIAYSTPIKNMTISLRKSAGVEVRVKTGSKRFPRGFTLTQRFPNNDRVVDLWMPIDRDGVCHVPGALAGTTFQIGRFSGEPIVIEAWDGQPFELP